MNDLLGVVIGLLNGAVSGVQNRFVRMSQNVSATAITVARYLCAAAVMGVLAAFLGLLTVPSPLVLFLIAVSIALEFGVSFSTARALQESPQSLVGPIFGLSIIFLVPLGIIFLGEHLTVWGIVGVIIVVLGGFRLGWSASGMSPDVAARTLLKEKGTLFMIMAATAAAFAVTIAKFAIREVNPIMFGFLVTAGTAVVSVLALVVRERIGQNRKVAKKDAFYLGAVSLSFGFGMLLHYVGLGLLEAAYYISIKRSSLVWDVLVGGFWGGERNIRYRLEGAVVIILGIIFITLGKQWF